MANSNTPSNTNRNGTFQIIMITVLGVVSLILVATCFIFGVTGRFPTSWRSVTPYNTTNTPTETPIVTSILTNTITSADTPTATPSPTDIPTVTSSPTNTPTSTPSPIVEPIAPPSPTNTPRPSSTPTPTLTISPTPTHIPDPTGTPTLEGGTDFLPSTSTPSFTPTPPPTYALGLIIRQDYSGVTPQALTPSHPAAEKVFHPNCKTYGEAFVYVNNIVYYKLDRVTHEDQKKAVAGALGRQVEDLAFNEVELKDKKFDFTFSDNLGGQNNTWSGFDGDFLITKIPSDNAVYTIMLTLSLSDTEKTTVTGPTSFYFEIEKGTQPCGDSNGNNGNGNNGNNGGIGGDPGNPQD